jgi:multimeric flavodoxin WrbA
MDIIVLNGVPGGYDGGMDAYVGELSAQFVTGGHDVRDFRLRDMNLKYCTGCFGCWLKTPGLCMIKDDAEAIYRAYVMADLVIMASPVIMGFTSAVLKRAQDRIIPLVLPYIEPVGGELHHPLRYNRKPLMGLLLEKSLDTDDEDLSIIRSTFERIAINAQSRVAFSFLTDQPAREVCHAINRI